MTRFTKDKITTLLAVLLAAVLTVSLLFSGCQSSGVSSLEDQGPEENQQGQFLTQEKLAEDYDYFWEMMEASYPFLAAAKRQNIMVDTLHIRFYDKIINSQTREEFYYLMSQMAGAFGGLGHLMVLDTNEVFQYFWDVYSSADSPHAQYQKECLEKASDMGAYEFLKEKSEKGFYDIPLNEANVTTQVIEEGNTAYVQILSFALEHEKVDGAKILSFFQNIDLSSYENLIIDIRGNGGGSSQFWQKYLVEPLLCEPVTLTQDLYYNKAPETDRALEVYWGDEVTPAPMQESERYHQIHPEDRKHLSHYITNPVTFLPAENGTPFLGDIWLLVDGSVSSASESFTLFCKETGFAKIVGGPTGGSGGGVTPHLFMLPNSGLLWRHDIFYTLNANGTSNEVEGTMPDILTISNRALVECMQYISYLNEEKAGS